MEIYKGDHLLNKVLFFIYEQNPENIIEKIILIIDTEPKLHSN